ncbi:MAG: hypothetical protein JHC95_14935 [Solirubrobacteraceae bacterium]|nr:hypothetical protein [Solirubrobacteraceae bacterium]
MADRKSMGRTRTERLRTAVDALPRHARGAMLEGVRAETIVAGAYVGNGAGICPMVAVHRLGVRTDANRFARAWDQFCGVAQGQARVATEREVRTLIAMLEASLLADEQVDLVAAVADHRALRRERHVRESVDLAVARGEHQSLARDRRAREAAEVGSPLPDWLSPSDTRRRAVARAARRAAPRGGEPVLALR